MGRRTWTGRALKALPRGQGYWSPRGGSLGSRTRTEQLGRVVADHRAHLTLREAIVEELFGEDTQPFVGIRSRGLAEIGGQNGAVRPHLTDIGVHLFPADLACVRSGKAALEIHTQSS